jgi:hypothetical protein
MFLFLGSVLGSHQQVDETPLQVEVVGNCRKAGNASGKSVRFINNQTLQDLPHAHVSTGNASPRLKVEEAVTGGPDSDFVEPVPEVQREESPRFWAAVLEQARMDLEIKVKTCLVLQLRMNQLRNSFLNEPDGVSRQRIQAEMARTFNDLEQTRAEEKTARTRIRDLQKEAADAGLTAAQIKGLTGKLPGACASPTYEHFTPQ